VVLSANSTCAKHLFAIHGTESITLLETGVWTIGDRPVASPPKGPEAHALKVLWSGELKAYKALHVLIDAVASLKRTVPCEVRVLGSGATEVALRRRAAARGVAEAFRWLGQLPINEAKEQNRWADVLAFTSLRDTSGNVVLEALAQGVPVVCFDHQGVADIVDKTCGVKVPVTTFREGVAGFAGALRDLATDSDRLRRLSTGAVERARYFLWERNNRVMYAVYQSVLSPTRRAESK
jgi:glycosyltransferase involved in cell wall biosynthesis